MLKFSIPPLVTPLAIRMVLVPADSLQNINFGGDPCNLSHIVHQDMMLFIYILFALGLSTVGSPFPASSNEFDDPGSISSNTAGLDLFGSDTLYAAKEVPNADTIQTFSLASSPDDSLFTDDLSDFSGLGSLDPTISVNLPSDLAVVGADDNIFGSTTLDDGLSGGLFDVDGSSEPFDLAAKPSNGAAGGCVSEIFQSIGKRKRLVCPTTYTDTDTDTETDSTPDTQTETKSNNQRLPPLDETIRRIPGFDQPDLLVKEICLSAFEPVCCTGQEYLGLLQTGCSKCRSSS